MIKIKRLIKQDSNNPKKKGVTYVELLVASAITFLVLGVIFVLWNFAEKAWYAERWERLGAGRNKVSVHEEGE